MTSPEDVGDRTTDPPARIRQPIRSRERSGCNDDADEAPCMSASLAAVAELMTDLRIVEFTEDQMHDGLERNPEPGQKRKRPSALSLNPRKKPRYRVLLVRAGWRKGRQA